MKNVVRKMLSVTLAVSVVFTCFTTTAFAAATSVGVSYSAHVQDIGWQAAVSDGATAGTSGQGKRVEALKANLTNVSEGAHINYQVHVQDYGWMPAVSDGALAGTTGEGKRIEAIAMTISGVTGYTIEYRVHVQDIGWMNWVSGGSIAGTVGQSKRIEAIQIRLAADTVSSFSVTPEMVLLAGGATGTIKATIDPVVEANSIIWSSSNTAAATVFNGVVTPVEVGTATITASVGGKTATCLVTVTNNAGIGIGYIAVKNQIVNGGFETGNFDGWLVNGGTSFPTVQNTTVSAGQYASFLGDGATGIYYGGSNRKASISQSINIANDGATPYLNLDYRVAGQDVASNFDGLNIYVNNILIESWWQDTAGWQTLKYDLSAYKGQTIDLKIESWTIDPIITVNYYVDNVSITY